MREKDSSVGFLLYTLFLVLGGITIGCTDYVYIVEYISWITLSAFVSLIGLGLWIIRRKSEVKTQ